MIVGLEPDDNSAIQQVFNWIGTATAILFFSSPLVQVIYLYKGKLESKNIPLFLMLTILFNCLFWVIYATQDKDNIIIPALVSNSIGLGINVIILFLFLYIFLQKEILPFLGYGFFTVDLLVEIYYLMMKYIVQDRQVHRTKVGFVATVIGVIMYASPAQNILSLFKTGNYALLPIVTNVVGFFNTLIWLLYGVLTKDGETMVSNGLSFVINSAQIGFWAYFFVKAVRERESGKTDLPDETNLHFADDENNNSVMNKTGVDELPA